MDAETKTVMTLTRDLITDPRRWTQGADARDASGQAVSPLSPHAVAFSAWGAMRRAGFELNVESVTVDELEAYLHRCGFPNIDYLNNANPHDLVIKFFDWLLSGHTLRRTDWQGRQLECVNCGSLCRSRNGLTLSSRTGSAPKPGSVRQSIIPRHNKRSRQDNLVLKLARHSGIVVQGAHERAARTPIADSKILLEGHGYSFSSIGACARTASVAWSNSLSMHSWHRIRLVDPHAWHGRSAVIKRPQSPHRQR